MRSPYTLTVLGQAEAGTEGACSLPMPLVCCAAERSRISFLEFLKLASPHMSAVVHAVRDASVRRKAASAP